MTITRRELGTLAAGGLFAGVLGCATKTSGRSSGQPGSVIIGTQSYSFRDRPLDEAIAGMQKLGIKECELWSGHVEGRKGEEKPREELRAWRLNTPLSHFEEIGAKFKSAGVDLYAYNLSFKDHFTDQEIDRGFEMAKALGAKAITASANQTVVARVAPFAKKHQMRVAVHNHSKIDPNEFATPEDFEKAITGPDREFIAINLDIGHFTAANFDAVPFFKKHHDRIVTLHIKDRKKDQGPNVPFGQGDTPIREVLTVLRETGWGIPANIEYEYPGADTLDEMGKCLAYCRQIVAG
jgi:sugar phosphate isomerase/epimerase